MTSKDFYKACSEGDLAKLKELVEDSDDFRESWVNESRGTGLLHTEEKTPLYVACENRNSAVVEYLLTSDETKNVIDPNKKNAVFRGKIGYVTADKTPLHISCQKGYVDIVWLLLTHPKTIAGMEDREKKTPLQLSKHVEIVKMLRKIDRDGQFPLHRNSFVKFTDTEVDGNSVPIVYRKDHNISFFRLETLHDFDSRKFKKIHDFLLQYKVVEKPEYFIQSELVSEQVLKEYHTEKYYKKINTSIGIAEVIEFWVAAAAPMMLLNPVLVRPMKFQVGGTILAGELAMRFGWGINLGGGMHHCSSGRGDGWCAFADLQLAILNLRRRKLVKKVMIIDLDAHQGNGHERDKLDENFGAEEDTFILDCYVHGKWPSNTSYGRAAMRGIDLDMRIGRQMEDAEYLDRLERNLKRAFRRFQPDLVVYNAGTDIMDGDPLGGCKISEKGIVKRDYMVWRFCFASKCPIMMVTSGGYQLTNGRVIAESIRNLDEKLGIVKMARSNFQKGVEYEKKDLGFLKFTKVEVEFGEEDEGEEEEEESEDSDSD